MYKTSSIKVIAGSIIKNGCLEEAFTLYRLLVDETRKERGCVSYELFEDLENPNHLLLIEEWASQKALQQHTQTEHFISLVGKLAKIETEAPVLICKKRF